jgi:ribonuclease HI
MNAVDSSVVIYTDGACDPNPGHGGWAAIVMRDGKIKELSGFENSSTNNRMELMAAIQALSSLHGSSNIDLYTDSEYLRLGIDKWMEGWVKRGWKRKQGKLANQDLWQELNQLNEKHQVKWHWVKGHAGDKYNQRVNYLAQRAIRYQ